MQHFQWKWPVLFLESYIPPRARNTIPHATLIFWKKYFFNSKSKNNQRISDFFSHVRIFAHRFNEVLQSIKKRSCACDGFLSSTRHIVCRQNAPHFLLKFRKRIFLWQLHRFKLMTCSVSGENDQYFFWKKYMPRRARKTIPHATLIFEKKYFFASKLMN